MSHALFTSDGDMTYVPAPPAHLRPFGDTLTAFTKALRDYELRSDMRMPFDTMNPDAKASWYKAANRLLDLLEDAGLTVVCKED